MLGWVPLQETESCPPFWGKEQGTKCRRIIRELHLTLGVDSRGCFGVIHRRDCSLVGASGFYSVHDAALKKHLVASGTSKGRSELVVRRNLSPLILFI